MRQSRKSGKRHKWRCPADSPSPRLHWWLPSLWRLVRYRRIAWNWTAYGCS